jgi:hypothetical protein
MKKRLTFFILTVIHFHSFAQSFPEASLLSHSQRWKIKPHRNMLGIAKPEFGPYATAAFEKLDSPVLRKRTRLGTFVGGDISSEGWDWDISKYETLEKRKAYRMIVAASTDTTEMLFSIYRISKEKRLTIFGDLISSNDEGKNITLNFKTNISGILITDSSVTSRFLMYDSIASHDKSHEENKPRLTGWYLLTGNDSIFTEPVIIQIGSPVKKFYLEMQKGIYVNDGKGNNIAALQFGQAGNLSNPFIAWIRNDIEPARQHAIASLFALVVNVLVR